MAVARRQPATGEPPVHPLWVAGQWQRPAQTVGVLDKYTGEVFARVGRSTAQDVDRAVGAAAEAAERPLPAHQRYQILARVADEVARRREELEWTIIRETGFTRKDASVEVSRAIETVRWSAEEARRIHGEMVPVEGMPGWEDRLVFTLRVPVGVVCAITPFNSPLNTLLHKVAPALAAGNAVVLKPATLTPVSAVLVCRLFEEAGLPGGYLNLVVGSGQEVGERLLEDQRIAFYAFTGSTEVGQHLQSRLGLRRAGLELGNISGTIVCPDADLARAARRAAHAAFRKAGQVCTSVQVLYVHREIYGPFADLLRAETERLVVGDPAEPSTDVGPMISLAEAERVEAWIQEAVAQGARVLTGGWRRGCLVAPTVLEGVPEGARLRCREVFGPVVSLVPVDSLQEAIDAINRSPYGLQAGVFTRRVDQALQAARQLRVGGVIINDTSSTRTDPMPYGGVKASGYGKEGPRYAIREMTEERVVVLIP